MGLPFTEDALAGPPDSKEISDERLEEQQVGSVLYAVIRVIGRARS